MCDFEHKLPLYKTAFSPYYDEYVKIIRIEKSDGNPVVVCKMEGSSKTYRFSPLELTRYSYIGKKEEV